MINDVVIAGAGPNGLMLACELSLAGVRPVVLDKLPEISAEPRANGLVGQVVRMLDRRGLYERIAGTSRQPAPVADYMFAAMRLNLRGLEDNPLYLLPVPQARLTPREAYERLVRGDVELVSFGEMAGRTLAVGIQPYPPGIPILLPGAVVMLACPGTGKQPMHSGLISRGAVRPFGTRRAGEPAGVLQDFLTAQPLEQPGLGRDHSDHRLGGGRVGPHVHPVDDDPAAVRPQQARHHRQGRGLPCPVRPDQPGQGTGRDLQVNAGHRLLRSEPLAEPRHRDRWFAHVCLPCLSIYHKLIIVISDFNRQLRGLPGAFAQTPEVDLG